MEGLEICSRCDMFDIAALRCLKYKGRGDCPLIPQISKALPKTEPKSETAKPRILYLCDRKACEGGCSNSDCRHTYDIVHALTFKRNELGDYEEVVSIAAMAKMISDIHGWLKKKTEVENENN